MRRTNRATIHEKENIVHKGDKKMLNGKTILVTGGTGSFGHHFVDYVLAHYEPKKIIIYSRDEFKQFIMDNNYKDYRKAVSYTHLDHQRMF